MPDAPAGAPFVPVLSGAQRWPPSRKRVVLNYLSVPMTEGQSTGDNLSQQPEITLVLTWAPVVR